MFYIYIYSHENCSLSVASFTLIEIEEFINYWLLNS